MKRLSLLLLTINILLSFNILAQIEKCKDDFCLPLQTRPVLSGNFGEPRSNHFHAGIDFKTYANGKQVVSVSDGYISRVSVSPWGYGLALFVTHPNGYTSVYAHLSKFEPELQKFVRDIQYERKSFSIDTILSEELFPVKKNQLIAYSGNTGSSEGPHLHFEIRETVSNLSLNTLNSIYEIKDNIKPEVYYIVIYPISEMSVVNGEYENKQYKTVALRNGVYALENNEVPEVLGNIGIGISYVDKMDDTNNRFGAESVRLYVNDSLYYHSSMKSVDFTKQECKNSTFDFSYYLGKSSHVHKAFVEANNDFDMFVELIDDGIFNVNKNEHKEIKIEIVDFNGNISVINFRLSGDDKDYDFEEFENRQKWNEDKIIVLEDGRVELSSGSLFYDNAISIKNTGKEKYSSSYKVGKDDIALKKDIKISLFFNYDAIDYRDKLYICKVHNKRKSYLKTNIFQNCATAYSNSFGEFYVDIDSVAPKIVPVNIKQGDNMISRKYMEIKITDNFSGIEKYDLYINDKWILGEYEPKNNTVRYYFDEHFPKAEKYEFKAVVSDSVGNVGEYSCDFLRK